MKNLPLFLVLGLLAFLAGPACAADLKRPVITVVSPKTGARVTNDTLLVKGTSRDENGIAGLHLRVNGQTTGAVSTNGFTNWTATVALHAGLNPLEIFAQDKAGNFSTTNKLSVTRVVRAPWQLEIVGPGSVIATPGGRVFSSQSLTQEIGAVVRLTAVPGVSARFVKWTGLTNLKTAAINFNMSENAAIRAEFAESVKPTVAITWPSNNVVAAVSNITIRGTSTDNVAVASVMISMNGGPPIVATGTSNWQANVSALPGANKATVYAIDAAGNQSLIKSTTFACSDGLARMYWPMQAGDYKRFTNISGEVFLRIESEANGFYHTSLSFKNERMTANLLYSNGLTVYDHPYQLGRQQSLSWGYTMLDPTTLAIGGVSKSSGYGNITGDRPDQTGHLSFTEYSKIAKLPSPITTPLGVFTNCVQVNVTFYYGHYLIWHKPRGWSIFGWYEDAYRLVETSSTFVLAPRVGPIRILLSRNGKPYLQWFNLVEAKVNGELLTKSPKARLAPVATEPFGLEIEVVGEDFAISWPDQPETILEFSDDLGANGWTKVGANAKFDGTRWKVLQQPTEARFYRLRRY